MILASLLLVLAADPHALAHTRGGPGHQLTVLSVDRVEQDATRAVVRVYGKRKVYACETGGLVAELPCAPCELAAANFVAQPPGQFVASFRWRIDDPRARDAQLSLAAHYADHFVMQELGRKRSGAYEFALFKVDGPKRSAPPPLRALQFAVEGRTVTSYQLPPDRHEVELEVIPRDPAGLTLDLPARISSACAEVTPLGPRTALVALRAGKARCEVAAVSPAAPGIEGKLVLARGVTLRILHAGRPVDTLELQGDGKVELSVQVEARKGFEPELQWMVDPGGGELQVRSPAQATFALTPDRARAQIVVREVGSGAETRLSVVRGG